MPIGKGQSAEMGSIMLSIILAADWQCETSALMNRQINQHYKLQLTRLPKGERNSKRERERERDRDYKRPHVFQQNSNRVPPIYSMRFVIP